MSPDETRKAVLADLEPLRHQKGVKSLMQKLSRGSSGESMVLINACKCIHVVKNWCFEARCIQAQFELRFFSMRPKVQESLLLTELRQLVASGCSTNFACS